MCTSRKLLRLAEVCSASVLPSPRAVWMSCLMRGGFHPLKVSGARRNSAQHLRDPLSKCSAILMPDMVRFSSFENLLCQVDFLPSASVDPISAPRAAPAGGILLRASGTPSPRLVMLGDIPCQVELRSAPRQARREWTHWDWSPGPAGREADMMPLRRPPSGTGGKETLSQHRRGMSSDSHRPKAKTTARGTDAQPDVRRVGGGRARTSPPPTAQHKPASLLVPCILAIWGAGPRNANTGTDSHNSLAVPCVAGRVALGALAANLAQLPAAFAA